MVVRTMLMRFRVKVVMQMIGLLHIAAFRHYKNMARCVDDLDFRLVQSRQNGSRHHFVDGPERGFAVAQIEHTIERAQQLIELMRSEQDCNSTAAAELSDMVDHILLVARIKPDQRLIEQ
jgi:hypothetical protein